MEGSLEGIRGGRRVLVFVWSLSYIRDLGMFIEGFEW